MYLTHPYVKFVAGIFILVILSIATDLLDALETFIGILLIPVFFFVGVGLISNATYELIRKNVVEYFLITLTNKVKKYREELKAADAAAKAHA